MRRRAQLLLADLQRAVFAGAQLSDAVAVDVEADGAIPTAELNGKRQSDIAESDDTYHRFGIL